MSTSDVTISLPPRISASQRKFDAKYQRKLRRRRCLLVIAIIASTIFVASFTLFVLSMTLWSGDSCRQSYSCPIMCAVNAQLQPNYYQLYNCTDVVIDAPYHVILSTNKVLYPQDPALVHINRDNDNCACPTPYEHPHYHHDVTAYSDETNTYPVHRDLFMFYLVMAILGFVGTILSLGCRPSIRKYRQ